MAGGERGRVWPRRVSAVVAWLFAVVLLLEGSVGARGIVYWPLAGVLVWLAIGVWKGRRQRAVAVVLLGALATVWFAFWTIRSATYTVMVSTRLNGVEQLTETHRPLAWTVTLAVEGVLAALMALGALPSARASAATTDEHETSPAVEA